MGREKRTYAYCVVKSAALRKKDGTFIYSIPFMSQFRVLGRMSDGKLYGEAYKPCGKGYTKYRGYVTSAGFSKHEVIDMANLKYQNITGKRIPTAIRFRGKATGWIERGEKINVVAYTHGWMLTGKGWTKAEWLGKVRDIDNYEGIKDLVYAVITRAVTDYKTCVKTLQSGLHFASKDLPDSQVEIKQIRKMFHEGGYFKIINDSITGDERLEILDKELGVTDKWMQQVMSNRKYRKP